MDSSHYKDHPGSSKLPGWLLSSPDIVVGVDGEVQLFGAVEQEDLWRANYSSKHFASAVSNGWAKHSQKIILK